MKIKIQEKEIELKKTFRSYIIFESITDKIFAPKTMSDVVTYFYSVVLASEKDINLTFDEFIDWLDENENALNERYKHFENLSSEYEKQLKVQNLNTQNIHNDSNISFSNKIYGSQILAY